jgi:hypothetical protein
MAIDLRKQAKPFQTVEGYGLKGAKLELNLQQCEFLGAEFHRLKEERDAGTDLTNFESQMMPFLKLFKDFIVPQGGLWDNMKEKEMAE